MEAFSATHNMPEYTVSELAAHIKQTIESQFDYVRIRGEISGASRAASGHLYLKLKDTNAVIDSVCWKGVAARLNFTVEDGLEVIATGRLTTYAARSNYQLVIEHMEPAGVGALMAIFEKRKQQLAQEGLFDVSRKRPLPPFPTRIGVITSPTGAVIRDILHRVKDRMPCHVVVWPTQVQGKEAANQIAAAISGFNALAYDHPLRPDLLIIARGGGSIEDLWSFNEEIVVRATANSDIPTISAIGHETDYTLNDFAADMRAPTPTAAAEIALPVKTDLLYSVQSMSMQAGRIIQYLIARHKERLQHRTPRTQYLLNWLMSKQQQLDYSGERLHHLLKMRIHQSQRQLQLQAQKLLSPTHRITLSKERLAHYHTALKRVWQHYVQRHKQHLIEQVRALEMMSYKQTLKRGYALVLHPETGQVIASTKQAAQAGTVSIEFQDGQITTHSHASAKGTQKPQKKQTENMSQTDLFGE